MVKSTGSCHIVKYGDNIFSCKLKGSFREKNIRNTNPVAVGDHVLFEVTGKTSGIITDIESRTNYIIRKATNLSRETQILAANLDQVVLMVTLRQPETPFEFIDRFLLSAEAFHIKTIIIINKIDIYDAKDFEKLHVFNKTYEYAGYQCISVSVKERTNLDFVISVLKDKMSLIAGNSGVGKSSLINYLCPYLNLKTSEVSAYHQSGKHATSYPEMIELPSGGYIIDSPGIRGFGIVEVDKNEVGLYFNELFRLSKNCRFYNCTHVHEPGCAVMEAIKAGILQESRYRSYLKILLDKNKKYRTG